MQLREYISSNHSHSLLDQLAKGSGVSLEQVVISFILSKSSAPQPVIDRYKQLYGVYPNLLMEEWLPPTDFAKIPLRCKVEVRPKRLLDWGPVTVENKGVFKPHQDEWWVHHFPFRCHKDSSIRRCRLPDYWKSFGQRPDFKDVVNTLSGLDYISAMNLVAMRFFLGEAWWNNWIKRGTLMGTAVTIVDDMKQISDWIKKVGINDQNWWFYAENQCFFGYMNLYPGIDFDAKDASKDLAHSGTTDRSSPTEESWEVWFKRACREHLYKPPLKSVEFISFKEWVHTPRLWVTKGSSSTGRLKWSLDELSGDIRISKNMIPDVLDLDLLYREALNSTKSEGKAILKNELSKIRVAVAGDLLTYLKESWLLYLTGSFYLQWEGSTIEESPTELFSRLFETVDRVKERYSLPFDYKKFDHQPQLFEVEAISDVVIAVADFTVALNSVSGPDYDDYLTVKQNERETYSHNVLIYVDEKGNVTTFIVMGGVLSGKMFTSLFGNGWNTIMNVAGRQKYKQIFGLDMDVTFHVRGDDSDISCNNFFDCLLFRQCLALVGADGNTSKFGIHKHSTEFLRVWVSDRCYGYPSRVIPNINQRKPWHADPLHDNDKWTAVAGLIDTCKRRNCDALSLDRFFSTIVTGYCDRKRIPKLLFSTPTGLGGFGILPFTGQAASIDSNTPVANFKILDVKPFRSDWWSLRALELGVNTTREQCDALAAEDRYKLISGDDIPAFAVEVRALEDKKLKHVSYWPSGASEGADAYIVYEAGKYLLMENWCGASWLETVLDHARNDAKTHLYGVAYHRYSDFLDLKRLLRAPTLGNTKVRDIIAMLKDRHITVSYTTVRRRLHIAVAVDWIFGNFQLPYPTGLNGIFDELVKLILVIAVGRSWIRSQAPKRLGSLFDSLTQAQALVCKQINENENVKLTGQW